GRAEVDAALKRAGWNRAVAPGSGRPIWVDAGGAQATAKQVRKALKAQFAVERAAPLTTVKGEAQPRQARSEAVDPVDPYAVRWPDVIAGIEALGLTPEGQRKVLLSLPGPRVAA
ncbi:hypothetical protein, partial [Aromatoleum sp.]|uniref:hypothetical protein n=1 Tax=Aromatoleum sp. TaxID=2307007 RepID=UPI002FC610DF